jgi:hypothetical protein
MAIDKKRRGGYAYSRPSYDVDSNASINAGMVAFLATSGGVVVATTAASGDTPIGTFWKDSNTTWQRATLDTRTFNAQNQITLGHSPLVSANNVKVTGAAGITVFTQGTDYTVNANNGIITRVAGGNIPAGATVIVWYEYSVPASQVAYGLGSFDQGGVNYDRQPNDTLGSGKIAVVEGFAHIYTDQFDVTQNYALNANLRSNANSQWTSAVTAWPVCGRVISLPTAAYPYLGIRQIPVP